jgi:hypothetical protein
MQQSTYQVSRAIKIGALGGIIGSIVLGIFAGLAAVTMSQEVFYVTIAKKLGLGDASIVGGWTLHFLVGLIAGSVFIGITTKIKTFTLTNIRKALWVGVLAGAAIWVVVYIPVTWLLVPADLTDPMFAVGSLVLHMLYGIVTATVAVTILRKGPRTVTA